MKDFSCRKVKKNCFKIQQNIELKKLILIKKIYVFFIIIMLLMSVLPISMVNATTTYIQGVKNGIDTFPESYQKLLKSFVEEKFHENWNFQAYYTGIDWNDFVNAEALHGRNRVHKSYDTAYRCSCNNLESGYYCANSQITSYFMDPRNFINERNIFQFLDVSYNEALYTKEIVGKLVDKYSVFNNGKPITFKMSDENHAKYNQEVTMTYTDIIMEAAAKTKMSPISMVVKIVQEVGSSGSASTDGKNTTYPNTYNFFNIGASDTGDAILNGLKYADGKGWHCPYTAIIEGAEFNSSNYIKAGQNTAYFYKFDCVGNKILNSGETQEIGSSDLYHQYMTNIQDPYSQSAILFETYTNYGLLGESLNFVIPVFDNMPVEAIDKISTLSNSKQELYYANVTSALNARSTPAIIYNPSNFIKTLYKDDLVIMLQRNYNETWDRVQLWDGQVGYIMSEFLEKFVPNTNTQIEGTGGETPVPDEVKDLSPIPHTGYGYANVSTVLNVRAGAGTTYSILTKLSSNEEFLILEETNNWYKICTKNGIVGFVSKEYVETLKHLEIDETNKVITVIPNVTGNIVAGKLNATIYEIKKSDVEVLDNSLGTGYVIKVGDKEYTVIKKGDVNGDAKINSGDLLTIQKHLLKAKLLEKAEPLKASDVNDDGKINSGDLLTIQKYLLKVLRLEV